MSDSDTTVLDAALRLWAYLSARHARNGGLTGPDPGVRWNYRVGRFLKSYLPVIRWDDDLYYLQAQGYWVLANWKLFELTGRTKYRDAAVAAADVMLQRQRPDGSWEYPNPEWRGRIATVEGIWASLGLLESYRSTGERRFRGGAAKWDRFLEERIGFQRLSMGTAVNYFADEVEDPVPNNTALLLRYRAAQARSGCRPLDAGESRDLLRLLRCAQSPQGEIAYQIAPCGECRRPHFQCFQYNAFIFLDVLEHFDLTEDESAEEILKGLRSFLAQGVGNDGRAYYACGVKHRAVTYHAAAVAAALASSSCLGEDFCGEGTERLCAYVLGRQRPDGSFPHSSGDYGFLQDRRSYPRYLAMILYHLTTLYERRGLHARVDQHHEHAVPV